MTFRSRPDTQIGYARVSSGGQKLDRQVDALTAAGCRRIFADEKSGKSTLRPELEACPAFLDAAVALLSSSTRNWARE